MAFLTNLFRRGKSQSANQQPLVPVKDEIAEIVNRNVPQSVINNTNFKKFNNFQSIEKVVSNRSVINRNLQEESFGDQINQEILLKDTFDNIIPIESEKPTRLDQYRRISALPECDWCLEEIANDFIHTDDQGDFINLTVKMSDEELSPERRKILNTEFKKYINFFDLENNGFELMKRLLIEGELAWENIINPDKPDLGILGIRAIPAEYYETLVDEITGMQLGLYIDKHKYAEAIKRILLQPYNPGQKIFDMNLGVGGKLSFDSENCIALLWPQVTYVNSGQTTPDGLIYVPIIEKAKQAYYQYVLLKDSAVTLRITRAPERLLFNIDTGNLPTKSATDFVQRFANKLKQRKVFQANYSGEMTGQEGLNPKMTNIYNSMTTHESYVFAKSAGSNGTSVETVGSTADYNQIDDLKFFLKILCKQFKIPWSRIEAPDSINEQSDSLSYEEYTFSRFVIRLQRRFAIGLKRGFITHLRLRGLFDRYSLQESKINVEFVKPVLYDLTQAQKLRQIKMETYNAATEKDEFSKTWAMKNILKMTDDQIRENYINIIKEHAWMAAVEYFAGKVDEKHPIETVLKEIDEFSNPIDATIGQADEPKKETSEEPPEETEEEETELNIEEEPSLEEFPGPGDLAPEPV